MPNEKRFDPQLAAEILLGGGEEGHVGLFEKLLGFRASTKKYKATHMMNDLAQTVIGGAPNDGGDFICRVIRVGPKYARERNSEEDLRADESFGDRFSRAFPSDLNPHTVEDLRRAAQRLLNDDKGVFRAGDRMTSPTATHRGLLGFEGYRRFGLGKYLASVIGEEGQERLKALYEGDRDPVSRVLSPLFSQEPLKDTHPNPVERTLSSFDLALGARLRTLLAQPFSKPQLLRFFALGASVGLVLKVLGAGREGQLPRVLALPKDQRTRPLREQAVQSFEGCRRAFYVALADMLPEHPLAEEFWERRPAPSAPGFKVSVNSTLQDSAGDLMLTLREALSHKKSKTNGVRAVWWPDEAIIAFGEKAGCVRTHPTWGTYLCLSPELLEVLTLMFIPQGHPPISWRRFWGAVEADLGLIIGAKEVEDAKTLKGLGVLHVSHELLSENASELLSSMSKRGVARYLPDSGAEVGGDLR